METISNKKQKRNKIIYWIFTAWAALGLTATGIAQLVQEKSTMENIANLQYPAYFIQLIAIWKILGAVAILAPKFPILKEWAYAGIFFTMTGAALSHIISAHPFGQVFPSLLLLSIAFLSWYFRPASRRPILAQA